MCVYAYAYRNGDVCLCAHIRRFRTVLYGLVSLLGLSQGLIACGLSRVQRHAQSAADIGFWIEGCCALLRVQGFLSNHAFMQVREQSQIVVPPPTSHVAVFVGYHKLLIFRILTVNSSSNTRGINQCWFQVLGCLKGPCTQMIYGYMDLYALNPTDPFKYP